MSLRLAAALSFSLLALSTAGCAADAEEGEDTSTSSVEVAVDEGSLSPTYVARVTRKDIAEGGGRCAGNLCTINGTTWNCSGGGYCSRIQF